MSEDKRPLVLISNDDGIHTPGIKALADAMASVAEVMVIAPAENQSAVSHKLSLHHIVRLNRYSERRIAVHGTPVDCVYLALHGLMDRRPDIILSGINAGPNLGTDVHYSGTVGAAIEGTLSNIPSIAVSCVSRREPNYEHAADFTRGLALRVLADGGLPPGTTLNVNVPKGEPREVQRTYLGHRPYNHSIERRNDPRGGEYFWIGGEPRLDIIEDKGGDGDAVRNGRISVTPMRLDTTDYEKVHSIPMKVDGYEERPFIAPPEGHRLGSCSE